MPLFDVNTEQGVFTIDADREPTRQEVEELWQSGQLDAAPPVISTATQPSAQIRTPSLGSVASAVGQSLMQPVNRGIGLVQGLGQIALGGLGAIGDQYKKALQAKDIFDLGANSLENAQTGAQSLIEAGARLPYNLARPVVEPIQAAIQSGSVAPISEALQPLLTGPADVAQRIAQQVSGVTPVPNETLQNVRQAGQDILQQPLAPEIGIGSANLPLANALEVLAPLAFAPGVVAETAALPRTIYQSTRRGLQGPGIVRTFESSATSVLKPLADANPEQFYTSIDRGYLPNALNKIAEVRTPKDLPSLIAESEKTLGPARVGGEINTANKLLEGEVINTRTAAAQARSAVRSNAIAAEQAPGLVDKIDNLAAKFDREMPFKEFSQNLKDLNDFVDSYYNKSAKGQATFLDDIENRAHIALRNDLSQIADDLYKGVTKQDYNPYRTWGSVKDVNGAAKTRFAQLRKGRNLQVEGTSPAADIAESIGNVKVGSALRRPIRYVRGGDLGAANRSVDTMFKNLPKGVAPTALSEAEAAALLGPRTTPLPVTFEPGSLPQSMTIDEAISQALESGQLPMSPGGTAGLPLSVPQLQGLAGGAVPIPSGINSELARIIEASRLANERARQLQLLQQAQGANLSFPD